MAALDANKALWPSKLGKIFKACLLVAKPTIKLNLVLGKILRHFWPPIDVWRPA